MWYFIIFALIVITISIIAVINILKLKKIAEEEIEKNKILEEEKRKHTIIINALSKINISMMKSIEELNKIKDKKPELLNSEIILDLKNQISNIDVLVNNDSEKQIIHGNLKDELNQIIKNMDSKIDFEFPKWDIEVEYDQRLLMAIKLILLKSIKVDAKNKIKIIVKNISKLKLDIRIENVKLVDDEKKLPIIGTFLNINENPFDLADDKFDPEFMIIRQNFIHSAKEVKVSIDGKDSGVRSSVNIVLEPESLKRTRNNIMALVVDDNKPTAKMNQDVLKEIGIDSKAVYSADECTREILTTFDEYDIIITDNQMPGKNGTDLIKDLKKIDGFDLPVVIVTGDSGQADYFINFCGFDGYIEKPLDKKKAIKTIKKLIKKSN